MNEEAKPAAEQIGKTCSGCRHMKVEGVNLAANAARNCTRFPPICAPLIQQAGGKTAIATWTSYPKVFIHWPACGEWAPHVTN